MFAFSKKSKGSAKKEDSPEGESSSADSPVGLGLVPSESGSVSSASGIQLQSSETSFCEINGKTCVKESGELGGRQFTIRNCTDSVLALLDHTTSITIEDCENCIIVCGPCRGSVFLRSCTNCLLLVACQQFRAYNSRDIEAHLLCSTKPTIEDTDLIVAPLLMSYAGMEVDMASAGLDRAVNRWREVQNFTPDSGQFQLMPFDPFANGAIGSEVVSDELLERLSTFMEEPSARELLLGPS